MQIFKDIDFSKLKNTVVTTGNFDGVHLGHQYLLRQLVSLAHEQGKQSVVVMFYPHPREVLSSDVSGFSYLSTQEDKYSIMETCGVDIVVQVPFNKALAQWSAEDFVSKILINQIGMTTFLVGHDHRLGNPKSDNRIAPLSEKYGFLMIECDAFSTPVGNVSSSIVRKCLLDGQVEKVQQLLGRPYTLKGTVVEGKKIGRTIGFPTANVKPRSEKCLLPAEGAYAVRVEVKGVVYGGMLQIGHRPTLDDGRGLTVEVHLFDFDFMIYDDLINISFIAFLRANQHFSSVDALKKQLFFDKADALSALG